MTPGRAARSSHGVDALAIKLRPGAKSARTVRVTDSVRLDFDKEGRLTQVELLDASFHVDRAGLEALPTASVAYSLAEAERVSGIRASTLRVQLNRGRIEGFKRGRDWLVDGRSLETYLASRDPRGRPADSAKARRAPAKRAS